MRVRPQTIAAVDRAVRLNALGLGINPIGHLDGGTHACTWLVEILGSGVEAVLGEFPSGGLLGCLGGASSRRLGRP
jgi:hypothetical protein